jgi:hypothetical protein
MGRSGCRALAVFPSLCTENSVRVDYVTQSAASVSTILSSWAKLTYAGF